MLSNLSRRSFVSGIAASAAALALPNAAFALDDRQAKVLVDALVNDINKVIASGKSESSMIMDFERIFARYGDVPMIARSALGPDARSLSSSQLKAYTTAFQGYIGRKYGKRFREFIGGKIEVQGARKVKSFYVVDSTVFLKGEAPFGLEFFVSDKSGRDKFFDMVIEGVSVRISEKGEIGAMYDRSGRNINALIKKLNQSG